MSTLILFAPPRQRLQPGHGDPAAPPGEYDYLLSPDGRQITVHGRSAARGLPRAAQVVLVLDDADVAWRRADLPRAGRQMRAALAGLLEEHLLDDAEQVHFALQDSSGGGEGAWVAVCAKPWLAQLLAELEAAQVFVDRIAPLSWPQTPSRGHFGTTGLHWSHHEGVTHLPLEGTLGRGLLGDTADAQWTGEPGSVERAQAWLGDAAITPLTRGQRALAALSGPWDLRQFDLARRARGFERLRHAWYTFNTRAWRPVRWGLAALIVVQVLGINLRAWQERHELKERRAALDTTLRDAFPKIGGILDASLQMQREIDTLRTAAGREGTNDLGPMLAAAAAAWPEHGSPVDSLHFEPGRLTLSSKGLNGAQIEQLRTRLASDGWSLDVTSGRLILSRSPDAP